MEKVDFKKTFKHLYAPSVKAPALVDVPPLNFLTIDGAGDPNDSQAFQDAFACLFGLAYTIKFMKKPKPEGAFDFVVPPPEGVFWTEEDGSIRIKDKAAWKWTLMIMQPDFVTKELVSEAKIQLTEKKDPPGLATLRYERDPGGKAVTMTHLGPYCEEGRTIEKMRALAESEGYVLCGKHREIYMNDPRRVKPEKIKAVLRHPVKKAW
ncbi:MAG TPA: GyrI-like domain-containing protein [Candidatus Brocadiia bacterium]|nr:GyrI-like domain-containing protein [Candidatus Brocadiia bacterium]